MTSQTEKSQFAMGGGGVCRIYIYIYIYFEVQNRAKSFEIGLVLDLQMAYLWVGSVIYIYILWGPKQNQILWDWLSFGPPSTFSYLHLQNRPKTVCFGPKIQSPEKKNRAAEVFLWSPKQSQLLEFGLVLDLQVLFHIYVYIYIYAFRSKTDPNPLRLA